MNTYNQWYWIFQMQKMRKRLQINLGGNICKTNRTMNIPVMILVSLRSKNMENVVMTTLITTKRKMRRIERIMMGEIIYPQQSKQCIMGNLKYHQRNLGLSFIMSGKITNLGSIMTMPWRVYIICEDIWYGIQVPNIIVTNPDKCMRWNYYFHWSEIR